MDTQTDTRPSRDTRHSPSRRSDRRELRFCPRSLFISWEIRRLHWASARRVRRVHTAHTMRCMVTISMIVRTVPVVTARIDGARIAVIALGTLARSELLDALDRLRRVILHGGDVDPAEPGGSERDVAHLDEIGDRS